MSCSRLIKHCPYYYKYENECLCPYWQEYVNEDYPCAKYPPYTDVSLHNNNNNNSKEETEELPFLIY